MTVLSGLPGVNRGDLRGLNLQQATRLLKQAQQNKNLIGVAVPITVLEILLIIVIIWLLKEGAECTAYEEVSDECCDECGDDDTTEEPDPHDGCPIYVDDDVDFYETGSENYPFSSIRAAVHNVEVRNFECRDIVVRDGEYYETVDIGPQFGSEGVNLISENGPSATVIDGQGFDTVVTIDSNGTLLDGFAITNGYAQTGGGVAILNPGEYIPTVQHNLIYANQARQGGGVYIEIGAAATPQNGGQFYIRNNIIVGNGVVASDEIDAGGGGIAVISGDEAILWGEIGNNVILGNSVEAGGDGAVYLKGLLSTLVHSNVIGEHGDDETMTVGLYAADSYSLPQIHYNLFNENTGGHIGGYLDLDDLSPDMGNIYDEDPGFVGFANYGNWLDEDFHLAPGSICIDNGIPTDEYQELTEQTLDYLDPDGTPADIGAYGGPAGDF